jgi:hypothetical protein
MNLLTKISNFFKSIISKITGKKSTYEFNGKPGDNVNKTIVDLEKKNHIVIETHVEKASELLLKDEKDTNKLENLTIEELRKMAGEHNILVKDSDSKKYIIGLINKHIEKDHK